MGKLINACMSAVLAMASLAVSARPPEGFWFPDLELTRETLTRTDPAAMTQICSSMSGDGFYVLSMLVVLKFDGNTLHISGVGGGPTQSAMLQKEDAKTGRLFYSSAPGAIEKLELEVDEHSPAFLQVHVAGRDNPELNALLWVPKSQEEVTRMDADLMKGNGSFLNEMLKVCR